jgi:DNA-binding MarR family transcriptional regulator
MISLRSKLRRGLLKYFYKNRKTRIHVRALAAILEVDPTNLSRELTRWEKEGFLRSEVEGRQLYYSVDPSYRALRESMDLLGRLLAEEEGEVYFAPRL